MSIQYLPNGQPVWRTPSIPYPSYGEVEGQRKFRETYEKGDKVHLDKESIEKLVAPTKDESAAARARHGESLNASAQLESRLNALRVEEVRLKHHLNDLSDGLMEEGKASAAERRALNAELKRVMEEQGKLTRDQSAESADKQLKQLRAADSSWVSDVIRNDNYSMVTKPRLEMVLDQLPIPGDYADLKLPDIIDRDYFDDNKEDIMLYLMKRARTLGHDIYKPVYDSSGNAIALRFAANGSLDLSTNVYTTSALRSSSPASSSASKIPRRPSATSSMSTSSSLGPLAPSAASADPPTPLTAPQIIKYIRETKVEDREDAAKFRAVLEKGLTAYVRDLQARGLEDDDAEKKIAKDFVAKAGSSYGKLFMKNLDEAYYRLASHDDEAKMAESISHAAGNITATKRAKHASGPIEGTGLPKQKKSDRIGQTQHTLAGMPAYY